MLQLTFDTSVYIDTTEVLQDTSSKIIIREFSARILYQGHRENHWQITSNRGEQANKLLDITTIRGPWTLGIKGFSELGESTRLASVDKKDLFVKAGKVFKKRNKDYAILIDHIDTERDWFITEDRDFFRFADQLQPHIIVLRSSQAVEHIVQRNVIETHSFQQLVEVVSKAYIAEIKSLNRSSDVKVNVIDEINRQSRFLESLINGSEN